MFGVMLACAAEPHHYSSSNPTPHHIPYSIPTDRTSSSMSMKMALTNTNPNPNRDPNPNPYSSSSPTPGLAPIPTHRTSKSTSMKMALTTAMPSSRRFRPHSHAQKTRWREKRPARTKKVICVVGGRGVNEGRASGGVLGSV